MYFYLTTFEQCRALCYLPIVPQWCVVFEAGILLPADYYV